MEKMLQVRMSDEEYGALRSRAAAMGVSVSELVRQAVRGRVGLEPPVGSGSANEHQRALARTTAHEASSLAEPPSRAEPEEAPSDRAAAMSNLQVMGGEKRGAPSREQLKGKRSGK
jgi:hypothetical protein